jgi:hypothetical protein
VARKSVTVKSARRVREAISVGYLNIVRGGDAAGGFGAGLPYERSTPAFDEYTTGR